MSELKRGAIETQRRPRRNEEIQWGTTPKTQDQNDAQVRVRMHTLPKFIILNAKSVIFNAKSIIFNAKSINFNAKLDTWGVPCRSASMTREHFSKTCRRWIDQEEAYLGSAVSVSFVDRRSDQPDLPLQAPRGSLRDSIICNTKFIILNTKFITFDTKFITFNTKFITFNKKFIIFNTKFITFNTKFII